MVDLSDLCNIATSMDHQMFMMNVKHAEDFRSDFIIEFTLPELDVQSIEQALYEREHGTLVGYEKGDEVELSITGIKFKLKSKKEYYKG